MAVLHRVGSADEQWLTRMGALQSYLHPASAIGPAPVDLLPVDLSIRDMSPEMDICEAPATGFVASPPAAAAPAAAATTISGDPPCSPRTAAMMFLAKQRPEVPASPDSAAALENRKYRYRG